jgi:hypothetical protein
MDVIANGRSPVLRQGLGTPDSCYRDILVIHSMLNWRTIRA